MKKKKSLMQTKQENISNINFNKKKKVEIFEARKLKMINSSFLTSKYKNNSQFSFFFDPFTSLLDTDFFQILWEYISKTSVR